MLVVLVVGKLILFDLDDTGDNNINEHMDDYSVCYT